MSFATDPIVWPDVRRRAQAGAAWLVERRIWVVPAAAVFLGALLVATSVPGVFTIDENNYLSTVLSLRAGRVTLPGTEGLTPSRMLAYFDPAVLSRKAPASPVASTAPPLYAFLALPFAALGWRGLIGLNALAFLISGTLVFRLARSQATEAATPWLALGTFLLAGHSIEYAQGVWPHMLSVALTLGGVCLAARARKDAALWVSAAAGLLCGIATGVRYQNLVLSAAVGAGILLASRRRVSKAVAFGLGFLVPLAACSLLNHERLGSWNPVSKGPGWMSLDAGKTFSNPVFEAAAFLATKVVDYSLHPAPRDPATAMPWEVPYAPTGAFVYFGGLKKAWLQSSPWLLLALVSLVALSAGRGASERRREARALLAVVGTVLAFFAAAGFSRIDGVCFNQRYFLELVPLAAVAFAWGAEGRSLAARPVVAGSLLGALLAAVPLSFDSYSEVRHHILFRAPLILALLLVVAWHVAGRTGRGQIAWPLLVGACLSYALVVHLGDDVEASRVARRMKWQLRTRVAEGIPKDPAALFARWGQAEPFGPLQLDHDLVILDTHAGPAGEGRALAAELLERGRRVFLFPAGMPLDEVRDLAKGFEVRRVPLPDVALLELRKARK